MITKCSLSKGSECDIHEMKAYSVKGITIIKWCKIHYREARLVNCSLCHKYHDVNQHPAVNITPTNAEAHTDEA